MDRLTLLVALCLAGAAPGAGAATPINETRELSADGRLRVENVRGLIHVVGGGSNRAEVRGSLGEGAKLFIGGGGSDLSIRVEHEGGGNGWSWWGGNRGPTEDTVLEIRVPASVSLDLDAVSADVRVEGIRGAASVHVDVVSGDVDVDAEAAQIDLESVSGDATFRGASRGVSLESVSGDIDARGVSGRITAESVSGRILLEAGAVESFKGATVSGDLDLTVGKLDAGRVQLESMSGDVTLALPASASARIEAETFSGSIRSDVGTVTDEDGPGSTLEARMGAGAAEVSIEAFSGDVEVKQR